MASESGNAFGVFLSENDLSVKTPKNRRNFRNQKNGQTKFRGCVCSPIIIKPTVLDKKVGRFNLDSSPHLQGDN